MGVATGLMVTVLAAGAVGAGVAAAPGTGGDATVCQAASATVKTGLADFSAQMNRAGALAPTGDLDGAVTQVNEAGATLAATGQRLTAQGRSARTASVRTAISDLSTELGDVGGQLADLTSLQGLSGIDLGPMRVKVAALSQACGTGTPTPTPGTQTPGTGTPGTQTPGTQTPGTRTPGVGTPTPAPTAISA